VAHLWFRGSLVAIALIASASCNQSRPEATPVEPLPPLDAGFSFGYGETRLDVPVGVSLAGYAARYSGTLGQLLGSFTGGSPQPPEGALRPHPYAVLLPASIGIHTAPRVKAFALALSDPSAAGGSAPYETDLVIAHIDMVVSSYAITDAVVDRVRQHTGLDLSQSLFLLASHTHSSAGRFADNLIFQSFGGLDSFSPEIFERLVRSISAAVEAALRDREPARMGVGMHGNFDPGNLVYHDRRHGNDTFDLVDNGDNTKADPLTGELTPDGLPDGWIKDRRLVVFRFDRADGSPKAAMVHFPVHGTILTEQNLYFSTDSTGMIEAKSEEALGIPVAHVQGATGDIQPAEVNLKYDGMERAAEVAAPVIASLFHSIQTSTAPAKLRSGVTTFRSDRQLVGYDHATAPYSQFDAPFGAIGCGVYEDIASIPTLPLPGAPSASSFNPTPFWCVTRPVSIPDAFWKKLTEQALESVLIDDFTLHSFTEDLLDDIVIGTNPEKGPYVKPGFLFTTKIGFFRIDGVPVTHDDSDAGPAVRDLAVFAAPGEPTTPWSFETRHQLALALGLSFDDAFTFGYANDHAGYILTKEDWITGGGGEIEINPWGPLWGEYLAQVGIGLARQVSRDQPVLPGPVIEPSDPVPWIPPTPSRSPRIAMVVEPSTTPRFGTVHAQFLGGDPIVDTPHVVIEQDDGSGNFAPVELASGRTLDESVYPTMLEYDFDETDHANPHLWSFHWELTQREGPGRYRFHVTGKNWNSQPARSAVPYYDGDPYELVSQSFEVTAASITIASVTLTTNAIQLDLRYPAVPDDPDPNVPDAFRNLPASPASSHVNATLTPRSAGAATRKVEGQLDSSGRSLLATPLDASATYDVSLDVADSFGNQGTASFEAVIVGAQ